MDFSGQTKCSFSASDAQAHLESHTAGSLNETPTFKAGDYIRVPKAVAFLFGVLVLITLFLLRAAAQLTHSTTSPSQSSPVPEMERLAKALVGDWNTTETVERGEFFPMAGRATVSTMSDRPPAEQHDLRGPLRWFCWRTRWHARHVVGQRGKSDYEQTVKGKKTSWRDSFTFTPTSHTLVAAVRTGNGTMQTLITTKATRR